MQDAQIIFDSKFPSMIQGDKTLLKIVFQNILQNGLKFVKKGVTPTINLNYGSTETNHKFKITDNGIGIAKEHLEEIFLTFNRLHSSLEYEGSGIGLATCKKIVDMHDGEINIESTEGKGSTFILTLPKNFGR